MPGLRRLSPGHPGEGIATTIKGMNMAMAKDIVDGDKGERSKIGWLVIEDSDGKRWRYIKGSKAQSAATVHIHVHLNGKLEILVDSLGQPLLRQNEPGLPSSMVVRFESGLGAGVAPGLGVIAQWAGSDAYEYDQE
jgi:hypothetical protein